MPEVYRLHQRTVDTYGCVSLNGLKYAVPAAYLGKEVLIRETLEKVIVLDGSKEVVSHPKHAGRDTPLLVPHRGSHHRPASAKFKEEEALRALGEPMTTYLDQLKPARVRFVWCVRKLYQMLCHYRPENLLEAVRQALPHRLFDPRRLETLLLQNLGQKEFCLPLSFESEGDVRPASYNQGAVTPQPDLSLYVPGEPKEETDAAADVQEPNPEGPSHD